MKLRELLVQLDAASSDGPELDFDILVEVYSDITKDFEYRDLPDNVEFDYNNKVIRIRE